jgi:hypothetical protein
MPSMMPTPEELNARIKVWDDLVAMADAVIDASDKYEGMMLAWRNECVKRHATSGMIEKIKERYAEIDSIKKEK